MNGVLIDISVWVDHFRYRNDALVGLLGLDLALSHPMIVTEPACDTTLGPRSRKLSDIAMLPQSRRATLAEVRELVGCERLHARGCGLVNLAMLASTQLTPGS